MRHVLLALLLGVVTASAEPGDLEQKMCKDLDKAQKSLAGKEGKISKMANTEFQAKNFDLKKFNPKNSAGLENKVFTTKEFNQGQANSSWQNKAFNTRANSYFNRDSSLNKNNQSFGSKESSLAKVKSGADKTAREDGSESVYLREKSVLQEMRYQGPEVEKIAQELKLINDTLKNKKDLVDHRISIEEIKEILNKE